MSAAPDYKVKGRGDVREVRDGDRLVGRIYRRERRSATGAVNFGTGRASFTSRQVVTWVASWGDSDDPVMEKGPRGEPQRCMFDRMKSWAKPRAWTPGRVLPRPAITTATEETAL